MDHGIGKPVRRKEDQRLLTGRGCFSDDFNMEGQAHAYFLRSHHAHADLKSIQVDAARAAPGVVGVFTGAEFVADGYSGTPHIVNSADILDPTKPSLENRDGSPVFMSANLPLATEKVRHVGEPVAVVIAETITQAKDGAELIEVDYQPLPAVTNAEVAISLRIN